MLNNENLIHNFTVYCVNFCDTVPVPLRQKVTFPTVPVPQHCKPSITCHSGIRGAADAAVSSSVYCWTEHFLRTRHLRIFSVPDDLNLTTYAMIR